MKCIDLEARLREVLAVKKFESHKVNVHHVITKLSHSVQKQRNEPHSLIYNGDIVAEMSSLNTTILNRLQGRVERQQRWI
jgi:hypothetical protein